MAKRIDSYFKKNCPEDTSLPQSKSSNSRDNDSFETTNTPELHSRPTKVQRVGNNSYEAAKNPECDSHPIKAIGIDKESDHVGVERDPGKRKMIWEYPPNKKDEIRRTYLTHGTFRGTPTNSSGHVDGSRKFLKSWYKLFPDWLEYSTTTDRAYCLPCFVFGNPSTNSTANAFVEKGFNSWKKVGGTNCAFKTHVGSFSYSKHKVAVKSCHDLMKSKHSIKTVVEKVGKKSVEMNRLRVRVSAEVARLCALQGIAFRGHDESASSKNRGNFLEIVKQIASYNKDVNTTILENAPQNATYASHQSQREILSIYASRIQKFIRDEIGDDGKFCIIVDESRDESKCEQMAIVLRFVDKEGFIRERFFDIVHVLDTKANTLKEKIVQVLSHHNLSIQNIRGQGYDGASNMRGEWNGLQALFLKECPSAYYVHCFAHQLQLVLVATSRSTLTIENFFSHLLGIINAVGSSAKRHDQLQIAEAIHIEEMIADDEIQPGRGKNQLKTLKRPGDTRWSSYLHSTRSLLELYDPTLVVLLEIINDPSNSSRSVADGIFDEMKSFEFVFIAHFMLEILGRADDLCRMLQNKSQDIVNALSAVSNTKQIIQSFRDNGWDALLEKVKIFCKHGNRNIEIPDMNDFRRSVKGRVRGNPVTLNHFFRTEIFNETLDRILGEMNSRFNEDALELMKLSSSFDPRDDYKFFVIDDICKLAEKFYPTDFTIQERMHFRFQLELFQVDIKSDGELQGIPRLSELCIALSKMGKSCTYYLVDRLIRLLLTLPVSTATTECAFSAMKIVKTRLRNSMDDDFLSSNLIMYIEKEICRGFDTELIIDEFERMKTRRVPLK